MKKLTYLAVGFVAGAVAAVAGLIAAAYSDL